MRLVVITDGEHIVRRPAIASTVAPLLAEGPLSLVLWTNRSYQQTEAVRRLLPVAVPAFVENGSALWMPEGTVARRHLRACGIADGHVVEFGCPRELAAASLHTACTLGLVHLDHASPDRHYDQPFHFLDASPAARLRVRRTIRALELGWTQSDGAEHVNGVVDPRIGLCLLRGLLETTAKPPVIVVGFGQTRNHLPVLLEADVPIIINHEDASVTRWLSRRVRHARIIADSAQAWAAAVLEWSGKVQRAISSRIHTVS